MAEGSKDDEGNFRTDINLYEKARPQYTKESVEYLLKQVGVLDCDNSKPLTILEVGAGTGKFTRALIEALKSQPNVRIIASDSQASMCEKFKKIIPEVEILHFKAEEMKAIPDKSIDAVIIAQAFHWFANALSVSEIHRVLVPWGKFGLIWNSRNHEQVDWVAKLNEIMEPFFQRENNLNTIGTAWKIPIQESKLFSDVEENEDFRFYQEIKSDDMVNLVMTLSSINNCSDEEKQDVERRVRELLANHPDLKGKSTFKLPYIVRIYWCTKI